MFHKSKTGKTTAFFHNEDIICVEKKTLEKLKKAMFNDPKGKARLCLHKNHKDKIQEMIIATRKTNYTRPHRHKRKSESFQVLEGRMNMIFFDNKGKITRKVKMASIGNNLPFVCRISAGIWHTNITLSDYVIFYEVLLGPFSDSTSEFPTWSPKETDNAGIDTYLEELYK